MIDFAKKVHNWPTGIRTSNIAREGTGVAFSLVAGLTTGFTTNSIAMGSFAAAVGYKIGHTSHEVGALLLGMYGVQKAKKDMSSKNEL